MLVQSFHGILAFQLFFIAFQYLLLKRKYYVTYLLYIATCLVYFNYVHSFDFSRQDFPTITDKFYKELNQWLPILILVLYANFLNLFLDLKTFFPAGFRLSLFLQVSVLSYFFIDVLAILITGKAIPTFVYDAFSVIFISLTLYLLYGLFKRRTPLITYILIGSAMALLALAISNSLVLLAKAGYVQTQKLPYTVSYLGVVLEVLFFSIAIVYKARIIEAEKANAAVRLSKLEAEKKQLELNMHQMRNKISSDLHDQVGSTLYSVSLYSQMAKIQLADSTVASDLLNRIGDASSSMLTEMNDIVWALNPRNDSVEKIIGRMTDFASGICSSALIEPHIDINFGQHSTINDMQARKNLFLIFKEAVTNSVKHSAAKNLYVSGRESEGCIKMVIRDDGAGFDPNRKTGGNGLGNMRSRVEEIGGSFYLSSQPGGGTEIVVILPLPNNG